MTTASPLIDSIRQALDSGGLNRFESFYVPDYPATSPDAIDNIGSLDPPLPNRGQPHPSDPRLFVDDVSIAPFGRSTTDSIITLRYATRSLEGDDYNVNELTDGEVSFEIYPEVHEVRVGAFRALPARTDTAGVDANGDPTGETIGVAAVAFETTQRLYRIDRARIRYTLSGTAADLGIPSGFSLGSVPLIISKQRELHVIQGLPLFFKVGSIRQTRRGDTSAATRFIITYEWLFERGVQWGEYPEGWSANPTVGPAGDRVILDDVLGNLPGQGGSGDILSGVGLPDLLAPPDIRTYFGGTQRWIVPPYCDVEFLMDSSGSYPIPVPTIEKRYTVVNPDGYLSLPGVG